MKTFISLLAAVSASIAVPNPSLTPGDTDPAVNQWNIQQTICRTGYTVGARKTTDAMKREVFKRYGISTSQSSKYEVDHLISLELGGADTLRNLWPQPYCPTAQSRVTCIGAREKDVVETTFKRRVCAGQMTLRDAQKRIAKDWYAEYRRIKGLQ